METLLTSLAASLAQQGPVFLMLAIAIYYLKQSEINAAMATLGGGYTLTEIDLSGYTTV